MLTQRRGTLRQFLRRVAGADAASQPDTDLLSRFVTHADADAFADLVARHGPLVYGTCRRVTGRDADAADAFQATFLVLARKAATIRPGAALAPWLYGVATRCALDARKTAARHARREVPMPADHPEAAPATLPDDGLRDALDAALARLPAHYRTAVVLCELQGRRRADVAAELGIPEGTLSSRLAGAKRRLARMLQQYAPALTAATLGQELARASAATVPPDLLAQTAAALPAAARVAALADGAMKALLAHKLRRVALGVLLSLTLTGGVALGWPRPVAPAAEPAAAPTLADVRDALQKRRDRYQSLLVVYRVTHEPHLPSATLMNWGTHLIKDYSAEHVTAFSGAKRYYKESLPERQPFHGPLDQIVPDPAAPPELRRSLEQQRERGRLAKAEGNLGHLFARNDAKSIDIWDGTRAYRWQSFTKTIVAVSPDLFHAKVMYFAAQGLMPPDPEAKSDARLTEGRRRLWFPDNLSDDARPNVQAEPELIDGAACIVVKCQREQEDGDRKFTMTETLWLDPQLGHAPRRWEYRAGPRLLSRFSSEQFTEVGPGCWLPKVSHWEMGPPAWVGREYWEKPIHTYHMTVSRFQVNDVPDTRFDPAKADD